MGRPKIATANTVAEDHQARRLRPAALDDVDGLHALASEPLVYRYLFDGAAPDREAIESVIVSALADAARTELGIWMLESPRVPCAGCVQLRPDVAARSAELVYLLDPAHWRRGLATRMAWTAIATAFHKQIDVVVAGTDGANTASLAVMRRLGMRLLRNVSYPLGPGVESVLTRHDPGPEQRPVTLHIL
jgi:RimJ/RimL family protein N-acetyltransferase